MVRPLLELLGIVLIVTGAALWQPAAACVIAGVLLITVANKGSLPQRRPSTPDDDL